MLDDEMSELRVWLLGGFRVEWAGQPVTAFESDKARALFCYLLLEARSLRREQLAGLFWGEQPEARARGNLSRVLSNLRDLFPACIASDRETIALTPPTPAWIDLHVLIAAYRTAQQSPAALSAALELYRGPLLAGFSLPGCPEFEEWQRIQQEQAHTLALSAWDGLIAYHRQRGEWPAAVACARRALDLDPWRESAHRQLMLLLALQGERDAALRQYEVCRHLLETELGVAPAPETESLYRRIVANAELTESADLAPPPALLPLVGRAEAHAWLLVQWDAARRSAGGLTLVAGEAGIGKTRLVQETLRFIAGQGARVLRGRCYGFNRTLPYQALYEALHVVPDNPLAQWLTGPFQPEARHALFAAIAAWLRDLCRLRTPCVIFLDDLHWADSDTLDLIHYLTRNLNKAPCWLVGAYRSDDALPDHPLTRLRQTLNRDGLLHLLELSPLTAADVAKLTSLLLQTERTTPLGDYLFRESEGNPFIIGEALAALREQGFVRGEGGNWEIVGDLIAPLSLPTRVQDIILQRTIRLDEQGQYLLSLAAAHGQPFDAELLTVAGECEIEDVETALADWQTRQLARPVADGWDIAHDKIRAALYQAVPVPLRRLLHARLAHALETLQPAQVALLAHHFDRAQQRAPAAHYLLQAGDQARQAYAQEQAGEYYRRGLALAPAPELRYKLLCGLESVCDMAGRREEQRAALQELAALVETTPALAMPRYQIETALRQAHLAEAISDYAVAAAAAGCAVSLSLAVGDDVLSAAGLRQWGYALRRLERLPEARDLYERAHTAAARAGDMPVLADALQGLANVAWQQGDYAAARGYLEQSLALCQELGDRRGEADAYNILGIVAQHEGTLLTAQDHYMRALELRRTIGDQRAQGLSHNNLGAIACELGEWEVAKVAYTTAAALCLEADDRWGAAIARLGLAKVALARGELAAAHQDAAAALSTLEQIGARQRAEQARHVLEQIRMASRCVQ